MPAHKDTTKLYRYLALLHPSSSGSLRFLRILSCRLQFLDVTSSSGSRPTCPQWAETCPDRPDAATHTHSQTVVPHVKVDYFPFVRRICSNLPADLASGCRQVAKSIIYTLSCIFFNRISISVRILQSTFVLVMSLNWCWESPPFYASLTFYCFMIFHVRPDSNRLLLRAYLSFPLWSTSPQHIWMFSSKVYLLKRKPENGELFSPFADKNETWGKYF